MIDVRVTVGIYEDLTDAEIIHMQLGALPRIGESILMTAELKRLAEKTVKKWGLYSKAKLNYVRCIAYDQQPAPVLMLGSKPSYTSITCIREDETIFGIDLPSVPRIGEEIVTPDEKQFFVESVIYAHWGTFIQLSTKKPLPETRIADDTPVMVEVANNGPIDVSVEQLYREIDVNVTNTTLYVDGARGV